MNEMRINVYAFPHKGLRNALSQVSLLAGNTDYSSPEELAFLKAATSDLLSLLDLHAHSEDHFVLPALESKVPGSTHENTEEHEELEKEVEALLHQINGITTGSPLADGANFYAAVSNFHSKYLAHMAHEESEILDLIWENFADEELIKIHEEIMKTFSPEQVIRWFKCIVPALNPMEQFALMAGFKSAAPAFFFDSVIEVLSSLMPEKSMDRLIKMLAGTESLQPA